MIKNYLIVAIRHTLKNKLFTFINISGLAIGMTSFILVLLYVHHEYNCDRYNRNYDKIFRLVEDNEAEHEVSPGHAKPLLPRILEEVPEVTAGVRTAQFPGSVAWNSKVFQEEYFYLCDSTIFDFFSWKIISGNKYNFFKTPHTVLISKNIAEKYFGLQNPVGKIVRYDDSLNLVIKGVFEIPENSHLQVDFIVPMSALKYIDDYGLTHWNSYGTSIYVMLKKGSDIKFVENKITKIAKKYGGRNYVYSKYFFQPLSDVYLYSGDYVYDDVRHGNLLYIRIFIVVSVLIVLIACFNYINLSTAKAITRTKEIAVRKVLGAHKKTLLKQLLGEAFIISILSALISLILLELSLPFFSELTGIELDIFAVCIYLFFIYVFLIVTISVIAGLYPAWLLARLKPVAALHFNHKVVVTKTFLKLNFRKILLIGQLSVTIGLIIMSLVVFRQMKFVSDKNLGFDKEQLLVINNPYSKKMIQRYHQFKNAVSGNSDILSFAAASSVPSRGLNYFGELKEKGKAKEQGVEMSFVSVDFNFMKTVGANIIQGRDFSSRNLNDSISACILNESAVKALALKDPLGKILTGFYHGRTQKIIGIVKDINYNSLHKKAEPVAYLVSERKSPLYVGNFILKLNTQNVEQTISFLESEFKRIAPNRPFIYYFVDDSFDSLYKVEKQAQLVLLVFTFLTIFISVFGLFGLILFITHSKTKEISIRKVFGAKPYYIVNTILKEFFILIISASVISMPLVSVLIDRWLLGFAYRINPGIQVFFIAFFMVSLIVFLTIIYNTYKVANINPAKALKYE